ncbi:neurofilament heavy polypeptide [Ceratobasidium sp. AG-Ba]|nr:neurofilament heavy polypeptide [Ceratobasidium sp. AG-Ba]QRW15442.1 neurofilament heavy polypeptide [Ceratobasidium sp. AG-Ba]
MEGRRSFVSSRSFASDLRPVPNIVALYERPRHKIRRDATHVLGGMFGWNTTEETERSLRAEGSRGEDEATATPDSATPVDSPLAGPSQHCVKKPAKRAKRRGFAPLIDMGASILNMRFQELLRRQHQPEEKENSISVSVPVKRPPEPAENSIISPAASSASKKAKISTPTGDAPIKRLRLTINTTPLIDASLHTTLPSSFLQMPPSPPDTSPNGSRAHAGDSTFGLVSASTPKDSLPIPADFEPAFTFPDSDSESSSSSESSSDLDSDSAGLSSSTSTGSDKGKGKANHLQTAARSRKNTQSASPTPSHTLPPPSRPSTPPRKKRAARKPGWVGWVQTEESPDHSRLIRLDDAPVILGRRTRSGKEFHDPPPPPPSRRKSAVNGQPTEQPSQDRPKFNGRARRFRSMGEKSRPQEAQKANHDGVDERGGDANIAPQEHIKAEEPSTSAAASGASVAERIDGEPPVMASSENQSGTLPPSPSVSELPLALASATQTRPSSTEKNVPVDSISPVHPASSVAPVSPIHVLTLTHSDAVITPTTGRTDASNEKHRSGKNSADASKKSSSTKHALAKTQTTTTETLETATRTPSSFLSKLVPTSSKSPATSTVQETTATSKPAPDTSAAKRPLTNAKTDVPKQFSIELKSRPSTSSSVAKPQPLTKSGLPAADASTGEGSITLVNITRTGSPSPLEKAKLPVTTTSANSNPTPSSSSSRLRVTTKIKPIDLLARKPGAAPTDRREQLLSKLGKNSEPNLVPSILGKRKEHVPQASSSHFKKRKLSRKLVVSSSDDSDNGNRFVTTGFSVNPFERRAKHMELARKGLVGEALKLEMDKWADAKRAEWRNARDKRRDERKRDSERSASDGKLSGFSRPAKHSESASGAVTDSTVKAGKLFRDPTISSKDAGLRISELPRIPKATKDASQSDHTGNSPKIQKSTSKIWNGDWGMDISKVSVTGSAGDPKHKGRKLVKYDAAQTSAASSIAAWRSRV